MFALSKSDEIKFVNALYAPVNLFDNMGSQKKRTEKDF